MTSGPSGSERSEASSTKADGVEMSAAKAPFSFNAILSRLKDARELVATITFFGVIAFGGVSYFATRDELETLDCLTRVNVRLLQANSNVNFTEQLARQGRVDLREQQRLLEKERKNPSPSENDVAAIQNRIDDLMAQQNSFGKTVEAEKKTGQKALDALTQNLCRIGQHRASLISKLASGEF